MFTIASTARKEGLLSSVGLPPQRSGSAPPLESTSSPIVTQARMLAAVSAISHSSPPSTVPAATTIASVAQQLPTLAPITTGGSSSSSSTSRPKSILVPFLAAVPTDDFSCKKGEFVACLAPSDKSEGYQFWIAEAAEPIRKPRSDDEADETICRVYY